jgi:hypothetical protein
VNCSSREDSSSKLIGFTITGCGGNNEAGVRCYQGSPYIAHNLIIDNNCRAVIMYESKSILLHNEIHDSPSIPGDAIDASTSGPRIEYNYIYGTYPNNSAIAIGWSHPVDTLETVISKNVIIGYIGGGFLEGGPQHTINNNLLIAPMNVIDLFNIGADSGLSITNNTLIGGGIWIQGGPGPHIRNNIIVFANTGIEIWSGYASIAYNNIWECATSYNGIPDQTGVRGNISANPLFVHDIDYHLLPSSPCIDAGDPNSEYSDEPEPNGWRINMGAYGGTIEATNSVPVISVDPEILEFGNVQPGSSAQLSLGIYNIGHDTLSIIKIKSSNTAFTTDFTQELRLISPTEHLNVIVTFTPTDTSGYFDSLVIYNNDITKIIGLKGGNITGIGEETTQYTTNNKFILFQNFPNPFNPFTNIRYHLSNPSRVVLKIYNTLGQEIRTLVNNTQIGGNKTVIWDGKDNDGYRVNSGIYIYRIQVNNIIRSKKMLLLK